MGEKMVARAKPTRDRIEFKISKEGDTYIKRNRKAGKFAADVWIKGKKIGLLVINEKERSIIVY